MELILQTYVSMCYLRLREALQLITKRYLSILNNHYNDVKMGAIASQITSLTICYSIVYSGADQSKHQSSASLAFVRGIHRGPVNSPHKWPVPRKMFTFDDVIMIYSINYIPINFIPSRGQSISWLSQPVIVAVGYCTGGKTVWETVARFQRWWTSTFTFCNSVKAEF